MAELSAPWGGVIDPHAGPYSDDYWSDIWQRAFTQDRDSQGVISADSGGLYPSSGGVSPVAVAAGAAFVDGKFYFSDANVNVAIPNPAVNPRIDMIVLRKRWANQDVQITRIAGVEGAGVPPAITQLDGTTWDLPLAEVTINVAGAITDLKDRRQPALGAIAAGFRPPQCRLTLTTGVPVTTTDVLAATTVYVTPYRGNRITLFTSSSEFNPWKTYLLKEDIAIAVPAVANKNYDVYLYDAGDGDLVAEAVAWTNDTTRATALATVTDVPLKTGALDRLFIGSFRTTAVAGQTEDSDLNRFVSNMYNRVRRKLKTNPPNQTWNHPGGGYQVADNDPVNNVVHWLFAYNDMKYRLLCVHISSGVQVFNGMGVNTIAAFTALDIWNGAQTGTTPSADYIMEYERIGYVAPFQNGYNYCAWLEYLAGGVARPNYGFNLAPGPWAATDYGILGWIEM